MKKIIPTFIAVALLSGCAGWQTKDAFEAGRIAADAVGDTADLVCTGPEAAELTQLEAEKCAKMALARKELKEALDALEAAWEDIKPVLDKHTK